MILQGRQRKGGGYGGDVQFMISAKLLGRGPNRDHLENVSVAALNHLPPLVFFIRVLALTDLTASDSSLSLCLSKAGMSDDAREACTS
jgi:hypothetical protein